MQAAAASPWNFERALWAAVGLHVAVFLLMGALHLKPKMDIPFQIVNIRLGAMASKKPQAPRPEIPPQQEEQAATPAPSQMIAEPTPKPDVPSAPPPVPQAKPDLQNKPAIKKPKVWKRSRGKDDTFLPVARSLEDYIKKGDADGIAGLMPESDAQVTQRYTQVLSLWLYKFRDYPEAAQHEGISGKAIIRLRIERSGRILFYQLDHSTGSEILDNAIRDMVYRASPVPEVPGHYPGGQQLEFLIPIAFTLD